MVAKDDWRRMGQESYLMGAELVYVPDYHPDAPHWDHEHCEFCTAKIAEYEGCEHSGYCDRDSRTHWICEECFRDFREEFHFTVVEEEQTEERP